LKEGSETRDEKAMAEVLISREETIRSGVSTTGILLQEYNFWRVLLANQPVPVQHFLGQEAHNLASALVNQSFPVRFTLPERVIVEIPPSNGKGVRTLVVPPRFRQQIVGGIVERLRSKEISKAVCRRLDELEASSNYAIAAGAGLVRFSTANLMIHDLLPSGRTVTYTSLQGEEIPCLPADEEHKSGTNSATKSGSNLGDESLIENKTGMPYVPWARRFYLPQWVVFDSEDRLLVSSIAEAEAIVASMHNYLNILQLASALAPYSVVDEGYQRKRYGIIGQLVNQGRALARCQLKEIIQGVQNRAADHRINRGLSLSLPYFDDFTMEIKLYEVEIVPRGRVMFAPSFVVLGARRAQAKVTQDTRLNPNTRKHLISLLRSLEEAFESRR